MYIIDKFAISNAAYYELSMLEKSQPKKYLMVQEKEKMDRLFHIEKNVWKRTWCLCEIKGLINFTRNK